MLPAVQFRMLNVPKHMQRVRNPAIKHPDEHTFFLDFHLCEDPTAMIADARSRVVTAGMPGCNGPWATFSS